MMTLTTEAPVAEEIVFPAFVAAPIIVFFAEFVDFPNQLPQEAEAGALGVAAFNGSRLFNNFEFVLLEFISISWKQSLVLFY
jgi:hypothetical protein